jgi:hypothetical protein
MDSFASISSEWGHYNQRFDSVTYSKCKNCKLSDEEHVENKSRLSGCTIKQSTEDKSEEEVADVEVLGQDYKRVNLHTKQQSELAASTVVRTTVLGNEFKIDNEHLSRVVWGLGPSLKQKYLWQSIIQKYRLQKLITQENALKTLVNARTRPNVKIYDTLLGYSLELAFWERRPKEDKKFISFYK